PVVRLCWEGLGGQMAIVHARVFERRPTVRVKDCEKAEHSSHMRTMKVTLGAEAMGSDTEIAGDETPGDFDEISLGGAPPPGTCGRRDESARNLPSYTHRSRASVGAKVLNSDGNSTGVDGKVELALVESS
ncbi:hypothetical protein FOZ63_022990, partial [Perkinsus olseni]